jgi:hypothetical protein
MHHSNLMTKMVDIAGMAGGFIQGHTVSRHEQRGMQPES